MPPLRTLRSPRQLASPNRREWGRRQRGLQDERAHNLTLLSLQGPPTLSSTLLLASTLVVVDAPALMRLLLLLPWQWRGGRQGLEVVDGLHG